MIMKFFYVVAALWLAALYVGEIDSEIEARIRGATFLIIVLIVFAVAAIAQRIDRAVKQIKEPDFDLAVTNRKDWMELGGLLLAIVVLVVVITAVQGTLRCVSDENTLSPSCIWDGIWEQIDEDLS